MAVGHCKCKGRCEDRRRWFLLRYFQSKWNVLLYKFERVAHDKSGCYHSCKNKQSKDTKSRKRNTRSPFGICQNLDKWWDLWDEDRWFTLCAYICARPDPLVMLRNASREWLQVLLELVCRAAKYPQIIVRYFPDLSVVYARDNISVASTGAAELK